MPDLQSNHLARIAFALGHPRRVALFTLLRNKPLAGHSLAQLELQSGLARGALIHHLRKMEEVSLIRRQQKGARTEYRLDGSALAPLYAMIGA